MCFIHEYFVNKPSLTKKTYYNIKLMNCLLNPYNNQRVVNLQGIRVTSRFSTIIYN
jgi:hypothetical protein